MKPPRPHLPDLTHALTQALKRDVQHAVTHDVTHDPRWARIVARDPGADGAFWYSVATTGVYCRPSCPSRQANPANVQLHDSIDAAEAAGFRACKRCNPAGLSIAATHTALVARACRLLDESAEALTLAQLAASVELSPHHFHRLFKQVTGLTPRAYAAAGRAARLRDGLGRAATITTAFQDAGFGANGHGYDASSAALGMRPSHYRAGGADEVLRVAVSTCALGRVLVACSASGVAAILLGDDAAALQQDLAARFPRAERVDADAAQAQWVAQVVSLVDAPARGLDLPLDVRGTAFQQRVWQALRAIPAGQTASYAAIAQQIGAPQAVRAVAGACAANALAVAIPCHRVVRADGGLSGYRWGVERKRALIAAESAGCLQGDKASPAAPSPWPSPSPSHTHTHPPAATASPVHSAGDGANLMLDLACEPAPDRVLEPGARLLRGYALDAAPGLLAAIEQVARAAPWRHMRTARGGQLSVAMTNCGDAGWLSDATGYRYDAIDPQTGQHWPALPEAFLQLANAAARAAGFGAFTPDACLINRYAPGAQLSLHQDRNEHDFSAPIVSVSLGVPATFLWGGAARSDRPQRLRLEHGDVVVWGGPARLRFHGVAPLRAAHHALTGELRFNLTFRRALGPR